MISLVKYLCKGAARTLQLLPIHQQAKFQARTLVCNSVYFIICPTFLTAVLFHVGCPSLAKTGLTTYAMLHRQHMGHCGFSALITYNTALIRSTFALRARNFAQPLYHFVLLSSKHLTNNFAIQICILSASPINFPLVCFNELRANPFK